MVLYTDGVDTDEEIMKCHEQIEYWTSRLKKMQKRKTDEERLDNLCKTFNKCKRCVYETMCKMSAVDENGNCKKYKRDAKDGGFYG